MNVMRGNGNLINALIKIVLFFLTSFYFVGCKTSKNGYSKMPHVQHDLTEERKKEYESFNQIDSVVLLTLSSGYKTGSEHNHYTITKRNDKTIVTRTSNFQKFKQTEISSSSFPWEFLVDNFDKFIDDTIKNEKKILAKDGRILYQQSASHGPTIFLKVKLGEKEYEIYLAPLVDSYNEGNINLDLIQRIKNTILTLDYRPSEKIKYKWER